MKLMSRRCIHTLLAVGLCLGAVLGYEASGARHLFAPPTVVAVVDLQRVLAGLDARAEKMMELKAEADKVQDEDDRRKAELEGMQQKIEQATEADRQQLREEAALAALNYKMWAQVQNRWLDASTAIHMEDLFKSIQDAVAELAAAQQYDLVLIDDSTAKLNRDRESRVPQEVQIRQQIGMRRILYRSDAIDITDALIDRMNNAFNAGG